MCRRENKAAVPIPRDSGATELRNSGEPKDGYQTSVVIYYRLHLSYTTQITYRTTHQTHQHILLNKQTSNNALESSLDRTPLGGQNLFSNNQAGRGIASADNRRGIEHSAEELPRER